MKIFIVILNFNGEKETKECLDSLIKCGKGNYETHCIVVDNDPAHPIKINASRYEAINLNLIFNSTNLGFSGGMNVGISYALEQGADYILILNNDTLLDENFLKPLLKKLKDDPSVGIVSPKIYYAKGYEFHKDRYQDSEKGKVIWYGGGEVDLKTVYGVHYGVDQVDKGDFGVTKETQTATGCCMLVKRKVFEKVGLFDEKYFLYYEDADLSERAKRSEYKIFFVPDSLIWHKNAQSSGGSGSSLQDYYVTRNRLYFGFKYASLKTRFYLLRESIFLLRSGRRWQKKGIFDYFFGIMGKGSYKND